MVKLLPKAVLKSKQENLYKSVMANLGMESKPLLFHDSTGKSRSQILGMSPLSQRALYVPTLSKG